MNKSKTFSEEVLADDAFFPSLINDIKNAKETINLSIYIFSDDALGYKVGNALASAAKRGVKVRVMVDGVGSVGWTGHLPEKLEAAGVVVKVYHPLPFMLGHWDNAVLPPTTSFFKKLIYFFSRINFRSHKKLCIIDSNIVYISSANISICHLPKDKGGEGWRDTTIRLEGLDTEYIEFAFDRSWQRTRVPKKFRHLFRAKYQDTIFYLNFTRRQRRRVYRDLLGRFHLAKKRIWIENAYFTPDIFLQRALIRAAQRGIDVRIVISRKSDVIFYPTITATFYRSLLKHNISIFEYLPSMLHAKVLIIDDWFCVGSTNLNSRSLKHDLEVDVQIQTKSAKKALEKQFLMDLKKSEKVDPNSVSQSIFHRILGWILLLFSYWY